MTYDEILAEMQAHANPDNVAGMTRFGISAHNTLGLPIPFLRKLARRIGTDHVLAQALWASGIHEARILAAFIDDPAQVGEAQMEQWAADFDSWDVCDQVCGGLFDRTPWAYAKAVAWSARPDEFVKRAGFALMAALAVHDKQAEDAAFIAFLPHIVREANDERNFVRKAVNWALRQIGKRNTYLNQLAIGTARDIQELDSRAARWIAADALRELTGEVAQRKVAGSH